MGLLAFVFGDCGLHEEEASARGGRVGCFFASLRGGGITNSRHKVRLGGDVSKKKLPHIFWLTVVHEAQFGILMGG